MKKSKIYLKNFFSVSKPIIGSVWLTRGWADNEKFERAIEEIDVMLKNDIDAILVGSYSRESSDTEKVLAYLQSCKKKLIYGVNIYDSYWLSFYFSMKYKTQFIQIDSVVVPPDGVTDMAYQEALDKHRKSSDAFVLGGVKYRKKSFFSLESTRKEYPELGMKRCDAIVVSGTGPSEEPDLNKTIKYREIIGNFPLVVGTGLTPFNCEEQLKAADAGIIDSYIKDMHRADGRISYFYTKELMDKVKTLRINK